MASHGSAATWFSHDSPGQWITLYVHTEEENDQIVIEPFCVYICGPSPAATPPLVPLQMAAVPPPSSRYSDSIPAVADAPLATASSMLGPRPRTPTVVAAGLSTRARTAVDAAVAQSTQDTDIGVLTQHQRLHLQSWLNDCRRCATSGIHRAAFSGDRHHPDLLDQDQTQAPPLSLAPLVSSSLRSPISSSATDACISATTIQERRRASVEPQVHATAGSEGHSPLLQVTEQEIVYSPSVYSSSTEVEVHVHVDTPCGSREIFQGRGAFRPSLTTIEDIAPHDGQPQPLPASTSKFAHAGGYWPVVTLEPAQRGSSRRQKDDSRADEKEAFGM